VEQREELAATSVQSWLVQVQEPGVGLSVELATRAFHS
jgi:hypothetical protein